MGFFGRRLVLLIATLGGVAKVGCLLPPDYREAEDSRFAAECICDQCVELDPMNGCARSERRDEVALTECTNLSEFDATQLEVFFRARCQEERQPFEECALAPLADPISGTPFVRAEAAKVCLADIGESARGLGAASYFMLDPEASTISLSSSEGSGTTSASGDIAFSGGNCHVGICPLEILWMRLRGSNFEVNGETIENPYIMQAPTPIADHARGVLFPEIGGLFFIEPQTFGFIPSSSGFAFLGINEEPGAGSINRETHTFALEQIFVSDGNTVTLSLFGAVDNFAPTVTLPTSISVECDRPGAALVRLEPEVFDVERSAFRAVHWIVDGAPVSSDPSRTSLEIEMSLGRHMVEVGVIDADGLVAKATTEVDVQDTTPPEIVDFRLDGPSCLWAPQHKFVVLEVGRDFSAIVRDACDPGASLHIVSAVSSQEDNNNGDGDTVGDIRLADDRVCLRSERQGSNSDGRIYSVQLHAVDAAGNVSDPTVQIRVAHDQSLQDCPVLRADEFVDDGDPRCISQSAQDDSAQLAETGESSEGSASCESFQGAGGWLPVFLVPLLLLARRRSR